MPGGRTMQASRWQRAVGHRTGTVARELLRYGIPELLLLACNLDKFKSVRCFIFQMCIEFISVFTLKHILRTRALFGLETHVQKPADPTAI